MILTRNNVRLHALCLALAFIAITGRADAQELTHAQVDIVAESPGVSLENGMWLDANSSFMERRNWLPPQEQPASYFAEFAVDYFAATPSVLTFTATDDARIRVELAAPWIDNGNGEPIDSSVAYELFQVDGAAVIDAIPLLTTASIRKPIIIHLAARKNIPVRLEVAAGCNVPEGIVAAKSQSGIAFELAPEAETWR